MPSRVRWVLSQIGSRRAGAGTLARLVAPEDLPGPRWSVVDERTWRTGRQTTAAWAERAAAAGSVTAWRSFRSGDRWLWAQVVPLAAAADGEDALRQVPDAQLRSLRSRGVADEPRSVAGVVVDGADEVRAIEQSGQVGARRTASLFLAFVAGADLVVLGASGVPAWTWEELVATASVQARRLRDAPGGGPA